MMRGRIAALLGVVLLLLLPVLYLASQRQGGGDNRPGRTRVYYVAIDEIDWTYVPARGDQAITGRKDDWTGSPDAQGVLDPNGSTYRKAVFREYTDSTFTTRKTRAAEWEHLGVLGPVLRAEVGDTIRVMLRNSSTKPFSLHPHGVFYTKSSEGFAYLDSTGAADKGDDAVAPGGSHTYVWPVPERAGPAHGDGSTAFWLYHSHVDEGADINAGLIGPIIVTRRGMAREDGSPTDVDREFVMDFGLFAEPQSRYWSANKARVYGDTTKYDGSNEAMRHFHSFFSINGYLQGNGPMLTMREGERVRWYVFTNPNEVDMWDIHTPHWHGQTAVVNHMRTDMVMLTPMMSMIADMTPDNPGIWLFHCHMTGHFGAGMYTRFRVLPGS